MRTTTALAFAAIVSLTATPASAEVSLSIQNGRVFLVAKDASLREILAEWARVGQTRIVNAERVPGGPMSLQLTDVSEDEALDVLLRPLSGYMAAPREIFIGSGSRFDRIVVMPTTAPPPTAVATHAPTAPPPHFQQAAPAFQVGVQPQADDDQEDRQAAPANRAPAFNAYPQPQVVNPGQSGAVMSAQPGVAPAQYPLVVPQQNQGTAPTVYPNTPYAPNGGGVAIPGMVVPVPQQQGQPGQPAPTQPKRPGPGGSDER